MQSQKPNQLTSCLIFQIFELQIKWKFRFALWLSVRMTWFWFTHWNLLSIYMFEEFFYAQVTFFFCFVNKKTTLFSFFFFSLHFNYFFQMCNLLYTLTAFSVSQTAIFILTASFFLTIVSTNKALGSILQKAPTN